jgi:hypothetical protein
MTTVRERLLTRRRSESFGFQRGGMSYVATVSRFDDGRLAKIFLPNHKAGSAAETAARDSAVIASIALQHGGELDTLRTALLRDADSNASVTHDHQADHEVPLLRAAQ